MNLKTAKKARKLARQYSVAMPESQLVTYGENKRTAVNDMKTTRGIYKWIKRLLRAGHTLIEIERENHGKQVKN